MNHAEVLRNTDRCVKCGLCLPHCPTYRVTQDEGDSPRGRITLMQGLMSGALRDDAAVRRHLEGCLGCRACEAVCPSGVPFGSLMDATRASLIPPTRGAGLVGGYLLRHAGARRVASGGLRVAGRLGLGRLVGRVGADDRPGAARAASFLPDVAPPPRLSAPGRPAAADALMDDVRGTVSLFSGCTAETFDGPSLEAAARVLRRLGYRVVLPEGQACCGALDHHAGRAGAAAKLAGRNRAVFVGGEGPILSLNSGCRAHLQDAGGEGFGDRVTGLCRLLACQDLTPLHLIDAPLRVVFHTPCTLRHVLREHGLMEALLRRLPGVELIPLPDNALCCGGSGSHMLTHPRMADRLLAPKLDALVDLSPDVLITANVGCGLHLAAGIRRRKLAMSVMSLAQLIDSRCGLPRPASWQDEP